MSPSRSPDEPDPSGSRKRPTVDLLIHAADDDDAEHAHQEQQQGDGQESAQQLHVDRRRLGPPRRSTGARARDQSQITLGRRDDVGPAHLSFFGHVDPSTDACLLTYRSSASPTRVGVVSKTRTPYRLGISAAEYRPMFGRRMEVWIRVKTEHIAASAGRCGRGLGILWGRNSLVA